jgi:hypothetical protein
MNVIKTNLKNIIAVNSEIFIVLGKEIDNVFCNHKVIKICFYYIH